MRLHRLELTGFGPFRERQVVDFDAFAADGIFLISGRTGAGKSSVLDGVTFALYGGVPRYDGSDRRLRSDHCAPDDPTRVSVEFSAGDRRWRVTRSPEYERPKQRGSGMTTEPHRAQLDELVNGEWIGRAARPVDVARELDDILGLSQQQFLQVILLAQNRFAEFLLAKNDERQRLLRRLFGTRTYEGYQAALEQRRKDAEHELSLAGDGVELLVGEAEHLLAAEGLLPSDASDPANAPPASLATRLEATAVGVQRAAYRAETLARERAEADAAHHAAEAAHASAKARHATHEQRRRSREALARLEAAEPLIAEDRAVLAQAAAAEGLRAYLDTAAEAELAAKVAEDDAARLLGEWRAAGRSPAQPDTEALAAVVERVTGDLAVWSAAEAAERELERIVAEAADGEARAAEFEQALATLDAARSAFPARVAEIDAALPDLQARAGTLESTRQHREATSERLRAARDAEKLTEAARAAEVAYLAETGRHDRARSLVTTLLRRRLAGHAAELAAALIDGEPCAVCGATEHPAPAEATEQPVSDAEIAAAEGARDAAAVAEKAAADAARGAREALATAMAWAGEGVAALVDALAQADSAAAAAQEAAAERDRLTAERKGLTAADAEARDEREALAAELAALRERRAALEAQVGAARQTVDAARGEFATVAERIAHGTALRDQASALAAALVAAGTAADRARKAARERDERIAASVFADAAQAAAALRSTADRDSLEERVAAHDVALRIERERLRELELELAGEPDDAVDLTATAAALAATREQWSAAVDRAAHAEQAAARLADLVDRAHVSHDGIAVLAETHAVVSRLANTLNGRAPNTHRMTLESFVLAAELEEIVEAANLRLSDMSSGRYRLQHSDALAARGAASGLGLEIMDAHTGMARPAQSLSGGETFLASLALALGLAEVVTARAGGVRLDTLFIDEGFGSLDDDTLELAMRTLDELRQGGRTVGLISHVAAMKEQIPAQLIVVATPHGPSTISQDAALVA
ncbi:AAA family ATPase [Microbacterium insulae]|uniref:Nuclease SbcCD subunit C n=1 Tax=Microbacterium insulae TaxID=483014 RepID=A0ABW3AEE5_9MICO